MSTNCKVIIAKGSVLWLLLLMPWLFSRCSSEKHTDLVKTDLVISGDSWKPNNYAGMPKGGPVSNHHTFTITNNSRQTTYHHIDVNVYYLDKQGNRIDSTTHRVFARIKPGESETQQDQPIGFVNPKTVSARLSIRSARTD